MKKKVKFLTMVMAIGLSIAAAVTVSAYSDDVFTNIGIKSVEGFYTRITDTQGDIHTYNGVIDAEIMGKSNAVGRIASYEIYRGEKQIIQVTLNDITPQNGANLFGVPGTPSSNGYYAVKFELSAEDNTEAFLTGLTNANLDLVQEKLIDAILGNSQFTMESLDFIDAEKTDLPSDGDDLLCWAASTANMLAFTGWGEKAGFSNTDDLMDLFVEHFTDIGSHQLYGIEWFFDGMYQVKGQPGWAQEKNPGSGGKYLKQYASERVMNYVNMINQPEKIATGINQLENGCGMGLGISWLDNDGNRLGGHAITCWGYICDKDLAQEDRGYYQALIVSDSDSDMQADPNRRTAPNKLQVLNMSVYQDDKYDSWKFDGYGGLGVLEDFVTLIPYSDDVESETDSSATLDKTTTPDLIITDMIMTNDALDTSYQGDNFTPGYLSVIPIFENTSDVDFTESFEYTVEVIGSALPPTTFTYTEKIAAHGFSDENQTERAVISDLPVGNYTVKITVNPEHTVSEAYYYNNEYTYDFVVSEQNYDPSAVSLTASIGAIQNGTAEAALTYPGLEQFDFLQEPGAVYYLMQSYYVDGAWQNWEIVSVSDEAPPDTCTVYAYGEKVKFRLLIQPKDQTMPLQQVYSEEYPLTYKSFEVTADGANTAEPSPIERGGKTLKGGEQFVFRIKNTSTESGAAECNAVLYAKQDDKKIELFRQDHISLNSGESTNIIRVSSWDAELSGSYEITVEIESASGNSEYVIGELRVGEKISYQVTIENDITDSYDGQISLREAVAYLKEYGGSDDKITVTGEMTLNLSAPIIIEDKITIDGTCMNNGEQNIQPEGAAVYGDGTAQLFQVSQDGELDITNMVLMYGYSKSYGGAVENNGGNVSLTQCRLFLNSSGLSGGAIYSNGGNVTLKNCSLKSNSAGYGGAIGTAGNAVVNMINCNLLLNSSNAGAVYNNSGTVNAIYSTFTDNNADSEGGGAITSPGGTANTVGCIITSNGSLDLSGNINVFGSYITAADTKVSVDSLTQKGDHEQLFLLDAWGETVWEYGSNYTCLFYLPQLSNRVYEGIYIKNDGNGQLVISADGESWEATGINSVFTDEAYNTDILGNPRDKLFGSYAKTCDTVQIIGFDNHTVMLYIPESQEASLIIAGYSNDGVLMDFKEYRKHFHSGTNRITVAEIGGDYADAMLWESFNSLNPLCEKYHLY